jgi:hypothetical protein
MTTSERAAEHARQAEELLDKASKNAPAPVMGQLGSRATAHATLALYYQREAER